MKQLKNAEQTSRKKHGQQLAEKLAKRQRQVSMMGVQQGRYDCQDASAECSTFVCAGLVQTRAFMYIISFITSLRSTHWCWCRGADQVDARAQARSQASKNGQDAEEADRSDPVLAAPFEVIDGILYSLDERPSPSFSFTPLDTGCGNELLEAVEVRYLGAQNA
eukprot:scaffold67679_cov14-Tisochrysis_lutea.AAC.1